MDAPAYETGAGRVGYRGVDRRHGVNLPAFEQFVAVRAIGQPTYSPTGDGFAYLANTTGTATIWWQPDGGGFPRQVTSLAGHRITALEFSPDGARIAFLADRHGDEMYQLYVVDTFDGWPRRLTDAPSAQYSLAGWTPDGRSVVVTANDRDPRHMDPQLIDAASGEVTRVLTGGLNFAAPVSPDGATIAILEFVSNTRQRLWLVDLATGERRAVLGAGVGTDDDSDVKAMPLQWLPDSSGLYALTDRDHAFSYLVFVDRASGVWRDVLREDADVETAVLNRGGTRLAAVVNVAGASRLRLFAVGAPTAREGEVRERPLPAPELALGVVEGVSLRPDGGCLVIAFDCPREATNLRLLDLTGGARSAWRTVEQSMLGGLDADELLEPELVTYPSFDRDIPAWLYRPPGSGPFPVVLVIHGGPEAQERPVYGFFGLYQYLVSRGIGVLAPNIRGSTGYGKEYQALIHRDWGGGELRDIEAAADFLGALDWVDAARVGVCGGSFGGFATLSALTRLPERWAAGVDLVGPSNLLTFVESVPPFWRAMMAGWVGDPVDDRAMLVERSPITYVDALTAPLLVIQGRNDPRVVKAESDQLVERLRARGVAVEYVVDETAGHGPADRDGWLRWARLIAEFLERTLLTLPARPDAAVARAD